MSLQSRQSCNYAKHETMKKLTDRHFRGSITRRYCKLHDWTNDFVQENDRLENFATFEFQFEDVGEMIACELLIELS